MPASLEDIGADQAGLSDWLSSGGARNGPGPIAEILR